jgi:hypothetical protein
VTSVAWVSSEAPHRLQVRRPRGGEGKQAAVLDQEEVVLPHPELELLHVDGARADATHERMVVLRLPDRIGDRAKAVGKALAHDTDAS